MHYRCQRVFLWQACEVGSFKKAYFPTIHRNDAPKISPETMLLKSVNTENSEGSFCINDDLTEDTRRTEFEDINKKDTLKRG